MAQPLETSFPGVNIAVVIVRNGDKFCVTDERKGWYLPCGRVDVGETFTTAAKREAHEEAGLNVHLEGLMRFEYNMGRNFVRFRCVFAGTPENAEDALKSKADDETYGAAWLSLSEVQDLGNGDGKLQKKLNELPHRKLQAKQRIKRGRDRLRAREVITLFSWAESETKVYDLGLFKGLDKEINHNKVKSPIELSVRVLICTENENAYLLKKTGTRFAAPRTVMTDLDDFDAAAKELLCQTWGNVMQNNKGENGRLTTKKLSLSFFSSKNLTMRGNANKTRSKLSGVCGIAHTPKSSKDDGGIGHLEVSYFSKVKKITKRTNAEFEWMTIEQVQGQENNIDEETLRVIKNHASGIIAPVNFIAMEGSEYKKLE